LLQSEGGNLMKQITDLFPSLILSLAAPEEYPALNLRMFSTSGSGKKPVVRAERRRPAGPAGGKPAGRAEAPVRRRPAQPRQPAPSSSYSPPAEDSSYSQPSYGGSSTGPSLPSFSSGGAGGLGGLGAILGLLGKLPRKVLIIGGILLCIAVACFAIFILPQISGGLGDLTGGLPPQDQTGEQPVYNLPTAESAYSQPTAAPVTLPQPGTYASDDTWLVMLYQDADDKILEQDIYLDLNEAEKVGSSANVQIVAQIDRYQAGFTGDGNWTSARRYYVTRDNDLNRVNSQMVQDLGEVNMAAGQTLVDFVAWAMGAYPADHYVLILSDHGMGWPGGWSDPTASGRGGATLPLASVLGDVLYLNELDEALGTIRSQTGLDAFELVGMDACLMGHVEVLTMLASHARYAVVSQETEPALGWAYAAFLSELAANPGVSGAELGRFIVESYIQADQRIVDDVARAEFAGGGSPLLSLFGGLSRTPSAEQLTRQLIQNVTLTAADLSQVPALVNQLNALAYALQNVDQRGVAQARSYSQSFTSIFGKDVPPSYIDLGHFAQQLAQANGSLSQNVNGLLAALEGVVIAEMHGPKVPGANGISIYFPNSQLYRSANAGPQSYNVAANRFAAASLWDDFLAFHYTGQTFTQATGSIALPPRSEDVQAPASGNLLATPLQLSGDSVAPGEAILFSTDIQGTNVAYVRLLVGYLDTASNSILVIDGDYLQAAQTLMLDGIYYPDWGSDIFTLEFEWEPLVFAINDGTNYAMAYLYPETYGASPEEAVYTVEGIYTFADSGEQRNARLYFSNGVLQQVFGFTGEGSTGAPHEIIPQTGDSFTILQQWMDLDEQGNVVETVMVEGDTLVFGTQMFYWEQLYAAPGEYIIGFLIDDLDGNTTAVYASVTVR
jgi:hypothetical protein